MNQRKEADNELQFSSFYLDDTLCGINIDQVQEINENLQITRVPTSPEYVTGIMNLRGQIVTIINLSMKLGFKPSEIKKQSRVIITTSKGEFIGLLVDKIADVITAKEKLIAKPPSNIKGAQGTYFIGILHTSDNELMALLNIDTILKEENDY